VRVDVFDGGCPRAAVAQRRMKHSRNPCNTGTERTLRQENGRHVAGMGRSSAAPLPKTTSVRVRGAARICTLTG
jgi:hypothetical protein